MSDIPPIAQALSRVPTGLYLLTTRDHEKQPMGLLASLVMQVDFNPPTMIVALGNDRDHLAAIQASGRFALSILDQASQGLMGAFFAKDGSPFDKLEHEDSPGGMPVFPEALAWLDCEFTASMGVGDHTVLLGKVTDGKQLREGDPSIHLRKNGLGY